MRVILLLNGPNFGSILLCSLLGSMNFLLWRVTYIALCCFPAEIKMWKFRLRISLISSTLKFLCYLSSHPVHLKNKLESEQNHFLPFLAAIRVAVLIWDVVNMADYLWLYVSSNDGIAWCNERSPKNLSTPLSDKFGAESSTGANCTWSRKVQWLITCKRYCIISMNVSTSMTVSQLISFVW